MTGIPGHARDERLPDGFCVELDPAITRRIGDSVGRMLEDREVQAKLQTMGSLPSFVAGADFGRQIGADLGIYADIIRRAGLKFP